MKAADSPIRAGVAGLIAMAAAMGIGRFAYTPILPAMMEELGLDAAAAGLIASANYLGYLIGAFAAAYGWAAGRERTVVIAALGVNALLLVGMAAITAPAVMAAIRLAAGVASAFVMVFSAAIVITPQSAEDRPTVQSIHFAGVGAGMALSALAIGLLAHAGFGWRMEWLAMALISAAALVAVVRLIPATTFAASARPEAEPALRWTAGLRRVTVAYGIFGFGYIVTATFLVAIVRADGGSPSLEAAVWLVTGLTAAVSVAVAQPLSRRVGVRTVVVAGCLLEAVGVAASVLVPAPLGALVGGILLGATFVVITAYGLQFGRAMAPQSQRRIFAFMTASFGTGQIIGPIIAGYLTEWSGSYTLASLTAAAALLLSAAMILRASYT